MASRLATMLKFRGYGIEIDRDLVDASQQLAHDFGLPVKFVHGSFIPSGEGACDNYATEFSALVSDTDNAYSELGLDLGDFDVFFAYPWPP